jgi:hypothetical protein
LAGIYLATLLYVEIILENATAGVNEDDAHGHVTVAGEKRGGCPLAKITCPYDLL